jgi:hypothetical protein
MPQLGSLNRKNYISKDYGNKPYGTGTVLILSVIMIMSHLTGIQITKSNPGVLWKPCLVPNNIEKKCLFLDLPRGLRIRHSMESSSPPERTSVADPGCLSRIPDPDFHPSPIPDPKQQRKRGGKKNCCHICFVAANFTKLKIILIL